MTTGRSTYHRMEGFQSLNWSRKQSSKYPSVNSNPYEVIQHVTLTTPGHYGMTIHPFRTGRSLQQGLLRPRSESLRLGRIKRLLRMCAIYLLPDLPGSRATSR